MCNQHSPSGRRLNMPQTHGPSRAWEKCVWRFPALRLGRRWPGLIPPQLPKGAEHSERMVHRALGDLPDPWVVIWDIPFGLFGRPRPGMAQVDFLLVHPDKGLCVIEVKGGSIEVREGTWYQTSHQGKRTQLRKSPFDQAKSQMYELQDFLWKHLGPTRWLMRWRSPTASSRGRLALTLRETWCSIAGTWSRSRRPSSG